MQKRIPTLLTNAYAWPRKMRVALANPRANTDTLNRVLYNKGKKVLQGFAIIVLTLVGKFEVLDKLWNVCGEVVEAARADEHGMVPDEAVATKFLVTTDEILICGYQKLSNWRNQCNPIWEPFIFRDNSLQATGNDTNVLLPELVRRGLIKSIC